MDAEFEAERVIDKAHILSQGAEHLQQQVGLGQFHKARLTIRILRQAIDEAAGYLANL